MKRFYYYLLYYIMGNIVFNLIFSAIKTIAINYIGGNEKLLDNICASYSETIIFYTTLFIVVFTIIFIHSKFTTSKLNENLKYIKKEGENNEK